MVGEYGKVGSEEGLQAQTRTVPRIRPFWRGEDLRPRRVVAKRGSEYS